MTEPTMPVLPDGSSYFTMSLPLPDDHWLTQPGHDDPPMPMRMGCGAQRNRLADMIRAVTRYAVRASTMNRRDMDFDPDAMVQNMIIGLLGYWTEDGLSTCEPPPDPPTPIEPRFAYQRDELLEIIDRMKGAADQTYWIFFRAGIGERAHAFIEFNGLLQKYVSMCEEAAHAGIDFTHANVHSGESFPVQPHDLKYLAEKLRCIFGPFIDANPEAKRAFFDTLHGGK